MPEKVRLQGPGTSRPCTGFAPGTASTGERQDVVAASSMLARVVIVQRERRGTMRFSHQAVLFVLAPGVLLSAAPLVQRCSGDDRNVIP